MCRCLKIHEITAGLPSVLVTTAKNGNQPGDQSSSLRYTGSIEMPCNYLLKMQINVHWQGKVSDKMSNEKGEFYWMPVLERQLKI